MERLKRTLPPNPKEQANFCSFLIFWWTVNIFKTGYRKILDVNDLFQPLAVDRSESLGDRLDKKWKNQLEKSKKPSLLKAVVHTFWRELMYLGLISIFNEVFIRLTIPVMLGRLLEYFRVGSDKDQTAAVWYGAGIVGLTAISSLSFNHFTMNAFHNGMKARVAVCSIIYRKSLRLSRTALGETAPGKVVNLLSNDVSRFDIIFIFIHSMWTAPMLTIVVGILLYNEIQWIGIVGIIVVFIVVPIQSYTGKLSSKFRYQTAIRTDERVRFMDEIINGVQVIKMYAWEIPFSKLITAARRQELKIVRKNSYVRALYMTFNLFTTRCAIFVTMMTMALSDQEITAAKIFVILSYYNIIAWTMSQMFVRGVAELAEAFVSLKRLQKYLENGEMEITPEPTKLTIENGLNGNEKSVQMMYSELPNNISVVMKNGTARWVPLPEGPMEREMKEIKSDTNKDGVEENSNSEDWKLPTLNDVNIEIRRGSLVGVIGPVGAGKSSLLQALLKELPLESGILQMRGKISYSSQDPWVFAASVRQNILFGQDMEKGRYDAVIKACALLKDFEQLSDGDRTLIGERGASLSGGQKARISLARAVYRKADIYLMDDPLSAVDAHVGRHLFDEVIGPKGRLARHHATRILVTHQVHFLKEADWIINLKDGKILQQGRPHELSNSGIVFNEIAQIEELDKPPREVGFMRQRSRTYSRSSERSLTSSSYSLDACESDEEDEDQIKSMEQLQNLEQSSKGKVKGSVAANYMRAAGPIVFSTLICLLYIITQVAVSSTDFWVSYWTSQEELRTYYKKLNETSVLSDTNNDNQTFYNTTVEQKFNDTAVLKEAENSDTSHLLDTVFCMIIHGSLIAAIFIIGIIRSVGFYNAAMRASQNLHDGMFQGIISAPMRFFDTNPSGRILNRFSKDMGATDEMLPKALLDAGQIILTMIGSVIVSLSVEPLFLVPVGVLFCIFMLVRKIYLKTSKNIKRVEGITRSPVFTHLAATLYGLSTIRAFGTQNELIKEFDTHQNLHTAAWYMFISTATAFGLSLDIICLIFMACVTFYFLLIDTNATGDKVGLAITQVMALTGLLQWGIRQSAEAANQFMSVERILEYRDLDSEKQPEKPIEVSKEWPHEGKIEFKNVFYRYVEGGEPVLRGLSFLVHPEEKVGIVGRTGAGKSSLIGSVFRLANVTGDIFIDGVETSKITLRTLRSKVSIIPQDPVLFSGTLRRNLDPFEEYKDADLWNALEAVELKDIASGPLGLQSVVMAGGGNFSVGQRQLVCLARAILRRNKILVLDEATANVDPHTDNLIQTTIRHRFDKCTVLTIAHRLHTIMDSDRVMVMNAGVLEEFDSPHNLLEKQTGIFKEMVLATGQQESERLKAIAREAFESKTKKS